MTARAIPRYLARLHGDEDGLAAGAEALAFGVLVFVVGTLLAVNAWVVVDAHLAANAAAREATRYLAETTEPTWAEAMAQAELIAGETLEAHGKHGAAEFDVVEGLDEVLDAASQPDRCRRITVAVRYRVESARMPLVTAWADNRWVTGRHSELVDPLRSGLSGEADCV